MKNAFNELEDLILDDNLDTRKMLLTNWIRDWVVSVEHTQHVVNKSLLNSNEIDFVWYKVAQLCAEDLIDNQVTDNSTTNNSFTCSILALRSLNGKLKEDTKSNKATRKN